MIQVDFYVLKPSYPKDWYYFACQLLEKIYTQQRRVYVCASSAQEAEYLNRMLWTFRSGSFIPHGLLATADANLNPILLGLNPQCDTVHDVLLNLAPTVPEFFDLYQRVLEIVDQNPERLQSSRERFRHYRELGCDLKTHELTQ